VAVVDLTRPEIGVPVVRVVIPGLEGPWAPDGEYVPGPRATGADREI
jgi:ribosomal protein S12 methylthiotransferase accessory factor